MSTTMLTKSQRISRAILEKYEDQYEGRCVRVWERPPTFLSEEKNAKYDGGAQFDCLFRPPTPIEWRTFEKTSDASQSVDTRNHANAILARSTVIHVALPVENQGPQTPEEAAAAWDALIFKYTGLPLFAGTGIAKAAGFNAAELGK